MKRALHGGRAARLARRSACSALALASALAPHRAAAQVHWDASAQGGVAKRFVTGVPLSPGPGPFVLVAGHVAVLPLVRAGAYVGGELSPAPGGADRRLVSGGARVKLMSPWPPSPLRGWLFTGVGVTHADAAGSSKTFGEVPLGVGLSYALRRPWELLAELGARFGFAASAPGNEAAALTLSLGVAFDR